MKLVIALLLAALALSAQTAITPPQTKCGTTAAQPMVFLYLGGVIPVCAQLDPAGFVIDKTTKPWTIRVIANAGPVFVDNATVTGTLDGTNVIFTLPDAPNPPTSLQLWRNGLGQTVGVDFTIAGNQITFAAAAIPQPGDALLAKSYRK